MEDQTDVFHETCGCSIGGRSPAYTRFLQERGKLELEDHGALPEFGPKGRQSMEGRPSPLAFEESQEGWITAQTIQFMEESVASGRPFFAHVSYPRPHQCTSPGEPFWSMYNESDLVLPPNADYEMLGKAPHMRRAAERWRRGDWTLFEPHTFEAGRLRKLHGYLGAVSQVDHAVGLLLDYLEDRGLSEDTIVIYAADHGDYACEHGIMEKALGICADAITRIPFIWCWPGRFRAGHLVREIALAVDVAPTLCSLLGVEPLQTADGCDITPLLQGAEMRGDRLGVTEFAWSKSVRKGRYRLVYYSRQMFADEYPDGFGELYDLEQDPWEMNNLFFDKEYRHVVQELQSDLLEWMITTTRPTTLLPAVSSSGSPQEVTRYGNTVNLDMKVHPKEARQRAGTNYL